MFARVEDHTGARQIVSLAGEGLAGMHFALTGVAPARNLYGTTIWSSINVPRIGFLGAYDLLGVNTRFYIPSVLPDVWLLSTATVVPKRWSPLLGTNRDMTGIHDEGLRINTLPGLISTPPIVIDGSPTTMAIHEVVVQSDVQRWNSKLASQVFISSIYNYNGVLQRALYDMVGRQIRVCQVMPIVSDWTCVNVAARGSIIVANTDLIPVIDDDGNKLYTAVTQAAADQMTRVMAGIISTSTEAWAWKGAKILPLRINIGGPNVNRFITVQSNSGGSSSQAMVGATTV